MSGPQVPRVYTVPAHRSFADALTEGILARHGGDRMALARGIILIPNNRAGRAITNAFVRQAEGGLLLPRLVPIGDPELGERLGSALDPLGEGAEIPPAIAPYERLMLLARRIEDERARQGEPVEGAEAIRLAGALAATFDQLTAERVSPAEVMALDMAPELSEHWQKALALFAQIAEAWPAMLAERGLIDLADRRNRLLAHVARRWREAPPPGFVIAAGIASTAPAVADVLRTVSRMEQGAVVLPGLDLELDGEAWEHLGPGTPDPVTGIRRAGMETHPQFALKLLLDRMSVHRDEVATWPHGGNHAARAERNRALSRAMLPPRLTGRWRDLKPRERSLQGVEAASFENEAAEAQAIALALREAIETPGRTAALVTPDRALAARVSAHLRRWGITANDTAGQPLAKLPPGTLLHLSAAAMAERFAPVPLLALLKHPLVTGGRLRGEWLRQVRALDLLLRGPRPAPGLAGIDALLARRKDGDALVAWWAEARTMLAPLEAIGSEARGGLSVMLAALREAVSRLSDDGIWSGHQGRAAAEFFDELERLSPQGPARVAPDALPDLLARLMEDVAVRPPQGGHPRIAIYGLLEARLQHADVMILGGLNEGVWPNLPSPDPWLAPRIREALGLPSLERRIGLSAHDFVNALGAPRALLSRAQRREGAPAIASRFWLRLQAMSGPDWEEAARWKCWAAAIDHVAAHRPSSAPAPCPPVAERPTEIAVTDVDRLKADPFSFYARKMLHLSALDQVDAEPSAAWRGNAVHAILEQWAKEDQCRPDLLEARARKMLAEAAAHPLMRTLWEPRLMQAVAWIAERTQEARAEGRAPLLAESWGKVAIGGVTLRGKVDRIDRMADGSLTIIDYKTGKPPSAAAVAAGYAMQLGLLGLIAERGAIDGLASRGAVSGFEYWSLARNRDGGFGYVESPCDPDGKRERVRTDAFVATAAQQFRDAAERWLAGGEPFYAKLHPEFAPYEDYDQLMRLDEWYGRGSGEERTDG